MKTPSIKHSLLADISFRFVQTQDASFILSLRNDAQLARHISETSISLDDQVAWLTAYKQREQSAKEFYFIIKRADKAVGTVRIYDLEKDSYCWGSWLIKRNQPIRVAICSVLLQYAFGFYQLGYDIARFDVRRKNKAVNRFHCDMGAALQATTNTDNFYTLSKSHFEAAIPRLSRLIGLPEFKDFSYRHFD